MKKISIFIAILIVIIGLIAYLNLNYKVNYNMSKKYNSNFESYLNEEIYGSELVTIINRAIDNNEQNQVQRNNKGIYIDDNQNSINIEIKIIDNNTTYQMENFANNGIQNFVNFYGDIEFKCTNIEYHKSTNKVKYMLFEQITS